MKGVPAHKAVAGKDVYRFDAVPLQRGKDLVRAVSHAVQHDRLVRMRKPLPQVGGDGVGRGKKIVHP